MTILQIGPRAASLIFNATKGDLARFKRDSPLDGEIKPGQVFLWEPLLEAAELIVVTRVDDSFVWSRPIDGDHESVNDDQRFRQACVRTILNDHPLVREKGPTDLPMPIPH